MKERQEALAAGVLDEVLLVVDVDSDFVVVGEVLSFGFGVLVVLLVSVPLAEERLSVR
jgi:hypothetical protein